MRTFCLGVAAACLLMAGTLYCLIVSGSLDPRADQPIPDWERWIAKTSLRAYLKRDQPKNLNPLELTDNNLRQGARLYLIHCAVCHGDSGARPSSIARGLYKAPPLFPNEDWSKDSDGLVYWFVDHGVKWTGMPAYRQSLSQQEIWQIVMFVKNMRQLPAGVDKYWRAAPADGRD